ncbi:ATP-binding protein [Streptomyces sp. MB09-01]|uniref:ATP-binding protein n=1 Tax=Streptomyces sp. MB09-01 TaxID=3028666 RepID=UPI0029A24A20|nr:ATP-binding protein [Streptomyces sp. MB09-01]MDX3533741.1 ATP-binding protein [Streptomyces sp. MB09-01]
MATQYVGLRETPGDGRPGGLRVCRPTCQGGSVLPGFVRGGQRVDGRAHTSWIARQMALWSRALAPHSTSTICAGPWDTSWPVAREPASVGRARRVLTAQLSSWGLHEVADTARLLVSELVTNALRHAHGPVRVNVRVRGAVLRCEVEDASPTGPVPRTANIDAESGRGIALIDALAQDWGSDRTTTGKTTWFELTLPHSGHDSGPAAIAGLAAT